MSGTASLKIDFEGMQCADGQLYTVTCGISEAMACDAGQDCNSFRNFRKRTGRLCLEKSHTQVFDLLLKVFHRVACPPHLDDAFYRCSERASI